MGAVIVMKTVLCGLACSTQDRRHPLSRTTTLSNRKPSFVTLNPLAAAISLAICLSMFAIFV